MNYFKKILRFAIPYKKYAFLNIFFNILYALFSALSFAALIPMLDVLFKQTEKVYEKPVYEGIGSVKEYFQDCISYRLTSYSDSNEMQALVLVISLVLILFFLKNIFNYLAMYFITFLRNGVLKDIRTRMYQKIVELPISFYSEKKKEYIYIRCKTKIQKPSDFDVNIHQFNWFSNRIRVNI